MKCYKWTTQCAIFLPREHVGLGIKKLSFIYYTTRIAFLVKMLNHDVGNFMFIARESLKLDMKKRNVTFVGFQVRNFLGYEVNENGILKCNKNFGCHSDWIYLVRYIRKIGVNLEIRDNKVVVLKNHVVIKPVSTLQNALYKLCIDDFLRKASDLSIQGSFFTLQNIHKKCSNSILFNWSVNDDLCIFILKARLSLFPTNFTLYLWDRQMNPRCPFGCNHTESMAHVLNGCIQHFGNFYSRRHDRIVEIIAKFVKESVPGWCLHVDKLCSTVFPTLADNFCESDT